MKTNRILIPGFMGIMFCFQAFAADTGSCGKNCRYTYSNGTLIYTGTGPNNSGVITEINRSCCNDYGLSGEIENIIIEEGITTIQTNGWGVVNGGNGKGYVKIPSTMTSLPLNAIGGFFETIEINSKNLAVGDSAFKFRGDDVKIILSGDADISFDRYACYDNSHSNAIYPDKLTILCKGKPQECLEKFGHALDSMTGTISADYYKGLNEDGNWEVWSDSGKAVYADSSMQKLIAKYDFDGNQIKPKRIYTVLEAEEALGKNNRNTFKLKYQ